MTRPTELDHLLLCLDGLPDPRSAKGKRHRLVDVLFIALVAMLAGADNAEAMQVYAEANEDWFGELLELPHGVPSQDTYLRVFAALDAELFQTAFQVWVASMRRTWGAGHVAIDGKTVRGSFDTATGGKAIHLVNAWLRDEGLVLGQVKVDAKANEIVAIPELVRQLDLRGAMVTIDAMGCQRDIAALIREQGAHYVLAVKKNQPTLYEDIVSFFEDAERTERPLDDPSPQLDQSRRADAGHGRIEERICTLSHDLSWLSTREDWPGIAAIAKVEATRHEVLPDQKSNEARFFIISDPSLTAADVGRTVRGHWGIENSLHWVLDMTFGEDANRTRVGNAAQNLGAMRTVALNLLRNAPGKKQSIKNRRNRCGWDRSFLVSVLGGRVDA